MTVYFFRSSYLNNYFDNEFACNDRIGPSVPHWYEGNFVQLRHDYVGLNQFRNLTHTEKQFFLRAFTESQSHCPPQPRLFLFDAQVNDAAWAVEKTDHSFADDFAVVLCEGQSVVFVLSANRLSLFNHLVLVKDSTTT